MIKSMQRNKPKLISQQRARGVAIIGIIFLLSGCSTYPTKFKCQDAQGLGCTMMSQIDQQIDSGEIEEIYRHKNSKGCEFNKSSNSREQRYKLKKNFARTKAGSGTFEEKKINMTEVEK